MKNLVIVDYGMGNLHSVKKKIMQLEKNVCVSSSPKDLLIADKIILPGVGHFKKAVENLKKIELWDILNEVVLTKKVPILGICLGMQLMAKHSEEGDCQGFGWFDAEVVKFKIQDKLKYKVPHTGWNQIIHCKQSRLMLGVGELSEFYFVHSYHMVCNNQSDKLNFTDFEYQFVSAIESENIFGVQYHPEKSHSVGKKLLQNFIDL